MEKFVTTQKTKLGRIPTRGHFDRATVYAILDAAPICHLALAFDNEPTVLPTIHTRVEDSIYLHGARSNRLLNRIAEGAPLCLTATLLDGLVLAKSGLHHSMNYRSVVVYGRGISVDKDDEKMRALEALVDGIIPGRWADSRQPTPEELRATLVIKVPIVEASAKMRTGPPSDEAKDESLPIWAGVLPLSSNFAAPDAADYGPSVPVPGYVLNLQSLGFERRSERIPPCL